MNSVTKNNVILKRLLYWNSLSPVCETETLPLHHRDTANREDSLIDPNSYFSGFSEFAEFSKFCSIQENPNTLSWHHFVTSFNSRDTLPRCCCLFHSCSFFLILILIHEYWKFCLLSPHEYIITYLPVLMACGSDVYEFFWFWIRKSSEFN